MKRPVHTRVTGSIHVAASILRAGGVVAFPTETVYGLGADVFQAPAVRAIFRAKGRPSDNPLIVHIAALDMIGRVARRVPASAQRLIEAFFPGPLTVVVPRARAVPDDVTAGLDTVGVRWPVHATARAFLAACGTPVAAPSANRSGRPSPTTWRAVLEEMDGRIPCILKGGSTQVGLESTVVDCTGRRPVVLREGGVTLEQLRAVVPETTVHGGRRGGKEPARSPGMKYRHYAPTPRVVLVDRADELDSLPSGTPYGYIGMSDDGLTARPVRMRLVPDVRSYAQHLFHFFRVCERSGVRVIACQRVPERGLGRALMDRLRRAASDLPTGC